MHNKLKLLIFIIILLMLEVTPGFASEIYNMNSEQLTYIYTVDDFDKTYTDTTGFFILMNDLDLSTSKYVGLISFTGTFYGNGHVLSNFTSYSGIFSTLSNAEIYDLGIEPGTTTKGIIASNIYNSKLENIYVDKIPDDSTSPFVYYLYNSTLNYVYTTGKGGISIYSSGNTVNSVYYNSENYLGSTTVGEGLSTTEMYKQINYIDWDFNNIWTIDEDVSNPTLANYNNFKLVGTNAYYNGAKNEISLKLFFNQELKIGTGNIRIFKKEDDSELLTLKASDSVLDVKIATLSSKISLDENTEYYIKVDADAFDNGSSDQVTDTFKVLYFESGDGTNEQPYEIYNYEDLNKIREGLIYAYKLMADLDLDEESMIPIGDDETPFTGVFDGNDHVIYNYHYEGLDESYIGLFGYSKGIIKNLGLKDLNINIQGSTNSLVYSSGVYVAGLVGFNAGIVENCYTTGEVLGKSNVGGLVGCNYGEITLCYSEANVTSSDYYYSGYNNEGYYTGGLAGRSATSGTISMSYATGNVTGSEQVGGLVGNAFKSGLISNSYATGNVIGYKHVGGLMGRNYYASTVENVYSSGTVSLYEDGNNSGGLIGIQDYDDVLMDGFLTNGYYNQETSGKSDDEGKGSPKTALEMISQVTYMGFDFDATWSIMEGRSMPYLNLNKADTIPGLINHAPDLTTTDIYTVEDTNVTGYLLGTDEDGDTINYTLVQMASSGSINVTTSGAFTYIPNENFCGDDQFSVDLTDGFVTTTSAAIKIHVASVNDVPSISDETVSLDEDETYVGQLIAKDVDENDVLYYTVITAPIHGSVTLNHQTGYFIYSPEKNYYGEDQFLWQVSDGVTTQQAIVAFKIDSVNDAPLATNKTFEVYYNDVLLINLESLVEDEDGDALTFDFDLDLIFGTAIISADSSQLSYTPINIGVETLVYSVSDANITTKAAITINIINAEQLAPTGLTVTKTSKYKNNGAITGTDSTMEYKNINNSDWLEITSNKISGLWEGTYILRYKAKLGYNAGENAYVTVETINKSTSSDDSNDKDDIYPSTTSLSTSSVLIPTVLNTTDTIQIIDGKNVTQVNIETDEIIEYLNTATQNAEKQKLVSFETLQSNDTAQFILTGEAVDLFNENNVNYSFIMPQVEYQFPSNAIDIKIVATDLGVSESQYADIKIGVNIKMTSQELLSDSLKGKALMSPIWFEMTASYTSESGEIKTIVLHAFNSYVKRSFTLPEDIDTTQVTTGVVVNTDGSYAHIPTILIQTDGEWEVQMNSITNSEYTIINNVVEVASVSGHWSENVVNRMASDLVLVDYESFKPDEAVTRGEFIDYVVRGLGLYRDEVDFETKLNDIENSTYAQSVKIADYWGIISGYENGTFKPNNQISREEAMMVFSNALTLIQFENTLTDNHDISQYYDKTEVSSWAVDAVNSSLSIGIFNGRSDQELAPKETLTCAEALIAVNNLLIKTNLISEK
jgi:hypothetical protein